MLSTCTNPHLAQLQQLLDRSYAAAGPYLLSIHNPERRLDARQVADRLVGMRLLVLATVTADGRPIVVLSTAFSIVAGSTLARRPTRSGSATSEGARTSARRTFREGTLR